jgi:hypothetical protein
MQVEALALILRPRGAWEGEISAKRVIAEIRAKYFLRLAGVRWELTDTSLVPEAGACTSCSKRSGAQPALFSDLEADDTCTDSECFAKKVDAARAVRIESWKAGGADFLSQDAAKRLFYAYEPYALVWGSPFVDLDGACEDDPDRGEWHTLIGREIAANDITIAVDPGGRARELASKSAAAKALLVVGYAWASKAKRELDDSEATGKRKASDSKGRSKSSSSKTDAATSRWENERATSQRIENFILERVAEKASKLTDEQLLRAAFMANAPMSSGIAERRGMKNATEDSLRKLGVAAKGPALRVLVAESLACLELDLATSDFEVDDNSEIFKRLALDPKKLAAEVRAAIADEKSGKGPGSKVDPKKPKDSAKPKGKAKLKATSGKPAAKAKSSAKKGGAR